MRIISASYRTDIPAVFSRWLVERIRAKYALVKHPFTGKFQRVSLEPSDVWGMVLWTRNPAPIIKYLPEIRARYPLYFQLTITGYPKDLEPHLPPKERVIDDAKRILDTLGPETVVWRYDPILITPITPAEFHVENFGEMARALRGITDEVVVSFAQFYLKTRRNLAKRNISWEDPPIEEKLRLLVQLAEIAREFGMRVRVCGQRELVFGSIGEASCIDPVRLSALRGERVVVPRKPHRSCGCYESVDIGEYNTCPLGCVYCYAVSSRRAALRALRRHDPTGESLIPPM